MRVMLIQPMNTYKLMDKFDLHEPLALEYIGAAIKEAQHEVILHDARLESDYQSVYRSYKPAVVGLTGFTPHLNIIKQIAAECKQINPKVFIIVGGHHATVSPQDFNCEDIDLVVRAVLIWIPCSSDLLNTQAKCIKQNAGQNGACILLYKVASSLSIELHHDLISD